MFPKWIFCVLICFSLCGFFPHIVKILSRRQCLIFVLLFHILLTAMLMLYSIQVYTWLDSTTSKLNLMVGFSEYFVALITHLANVIEAFVQREYQRKFWRIYKIVDRKYAQQYNQNFRSYSVKFFQHFMFNIINIYFIRAESILTLCVFVPLALLLAFGRLRIFFYLFYLQLVRFKLRVLAKEAHQNTTYSKQPDPDLKTRNRTQHRFKSIRKDYESVCVMNDYINSIFGWSILLTILSSIIYLQSSVSWFYYYSRRRSIFFQLSMFFEFFLIFL